MSLLIFFDVCMEKLYSVDMIQVAWWIRAHLRQILLEQKLEFSGTLTTRV